MLRYLLLFTCLLLTWPLLGQELQVQPPARDLQGDPLPAGALARLGTVRFRHDDTVVFAAFLPGNKSVLSVSADGIICVWEFPAGKRISRLEVNPEADRLAAAAPKVTSANLSPDGQRLLVFGSNGVMSVWDWANGKQLGTVADAGTGTRGPLGPVFSPDGKTMMLAGASRILQFVDVASGKTTGPTVGHGGPLASIAFTADGAKVVTRDSKASHTWEAATGKNLGSTPIPFAANAPAKGSASALSVLGGTVISPNGRFRLEVARFASLADAQAATARDAIFHDTATGKELGKIELEVEVTPVHRKPLVFSPDSKILAAVAGDVKVRIDLYEVPTGKKLRSLDAGPAQGPVRKGKAAAAGGILATPFGTVGQKIVFSSDGRVLFFLFGPGSPILVLDTVTGKQLCSLPALEGNAAIHNVYSLDGRTVLLDMNDGTLKVFELATAQPRHSYGTKLPPLPPAPVSTKSATLADLLGDPQLGSLALAKPRVSVAISPDIKLLALSGPGGSVHIWDILTGKELAVLKGHTAVVNALAFAPHGKTLASASGDATALIWDMTTIPRPALAGKAPLPAELEKWWQALAEKDAAKAYDAMGHFAKAPPDAVAWIAERVKPAEFDPQGIDALIVQLDDKQYKIREVATKELLKIGEPVLPLLDKALATGPPPEAKNRMEIVRDKLTTQPMEGERLRIYRAIELLEIIGTLPARQHLEALAKGAPAALVTESAKAALKR